MLTVLSVLGFLALSILSPTGPAAGTVVLPGGSAGIGFDDLQFSRSLDLLLVPGGRTGNLDLVNPRTASVTSISGFSSSTAYKGGHGEGITSVSEGEGRLYVTDRTTLVLSVADPTSRKIVSQTKLAASPDYVRYVAPTHEIWVTEPDKDQIEIFQLSAEGLAAPRHAALVRVANGPESLVVDATRGRAYTHLWSGTTLALDLKTKAVLARWPNTCQGSRGIALDEKRGLLFVGCGEGKAVVLEVTRDGKVIGSASTGAGVDIIDYDATLHHLYVPGGRSATLSILGVGAGGALTELARLPAAVEGHCVVSDQHGRAYVCDPKGGRLLVFKDDFPVTAWP
jgi:hypothetical protein